MPRRTVMALVALALAATLAGCTGIPYSSGVNQGVAVNNAPDAAIQFIPAAPAEGASAEQILRGFVDAGTSPVGDWSIARQYLTPDFARTWNPGAGVLVDNGSRIVTASGTNKLALSTDVGAAVDEDGNYSARSSTVQQKLTFTMAQVDGQWRIASGPNGVILDSASFPRVFSQIPLFFYTPDFTSLIPDVRWFPARSSAPTRVVKALMKGPSSWLATTGSAVTSIPAGAALVADAVPVESGAATVNFDAKTIKNADGLPDRILRQVSASMTSLADVASVNLLFSGAVQGQTPVPAQVSLLGSSAPSAALVNRENQFGFLNGNFVIKIKGISDRVVALAPRAVALATDQTFAAVTTASSVVGVSSSLKQTVIDDRPQLLPAAMDRDAFTWTISNSQPGVVRVTGRSGASATLPAPWVGATSVSAIAISPDGSRLVAATQGTSGSQLCAASISRGSNLWPASIGPCLSLLAPAGRVTSLAWIDQTRIGILSSDQSAKLRILTVGGNYSDVIPPLGATSISGSGSTGALRVLTNYGDLYEQVSPTRWSVIAGKVTVLGFAQ
jgi:hypothetical protein